MQSSSRRRGALVAVVSFAVLGVAFAAPSTLGSFESKTTQANNAVAAIRGRVADIETLKKQAEQEGKKFKAGCIEEKLQRARANEGAAGVIMDGWGLGAADLGYAQRQLDRLLLLQVYAMVYYEDARACGDARVGGAGDTRPPGAPPLGGDPPPPAPPPEIPRPPRFDRPPPLSAY